jgi:hypothetical protein
MQINEIIAALFQFVDCVTPHPLNPHNRHFAIKPAGYSMIINHIAEDADYSNKSSNLNRYLIFISNNL